KGIERPMDRASRRLEPARRAGVVLFVSRNDRRRLGSSVDLGLGRLVDRLCDPYLANVFWRDGYGSGPVGHEGNQAASIYRCVRLDRLKYPGSLGISSLYLWTGFARPVSDG